MTPDAGFWRGRRVLLTGHTGFKGAWTALWLERAGAMVHGLALPPEPGESLFAALGAWPSLVSHFGDIRERAFVRDVLAAAAPEIVIHMAAQAIVRRSFREPVETFATNVMGTAHVLDAAQSTGTAKAILVVTSDKVYDNRDSGRRFREEDALAGDDPYSASKAAAEQVARAWRDSYWRETGPAVGVARAGNVIGGGDWAQDRIVPDVIRAGRAGQPVVLRYPQSTRPWQFVLDVVAGYLSYAERILRNGRAAPSAINFGPPPEEVPLTIEQMVLRLQQAFGWSHGWVRAEGRALPEKTRLALDVDLAERYLGWRRRLDAATALGWIARWHGAHADGADMRAVSLRQIADFEALAPDVAGAGGRR